jgi:tetratricopeptide (TPR) repeat protein
MNFKFAGESIEGGQEQLNSNFGYDEFKKIDNFDYIVNQNKVFCRFELSDIYIRKGNENYLKKDYNSARIDYEKALKFFPESATPYFNLGVLYQKGLYFDEALEYFNEAIKKDATFGEAYFHRAILKIKIGFDENYEKEIIEDFYSGIDNSLWEDGDFFEKTDAEFRLVGDNIGSYLKGYFKELFREEDL